MKSNNSQSFKTNVFDSVAVCRWRTGAFMGFMFASSSGALFMVFNAGGKAVAAGRTTPGELTSFATYTFLLGLGTSGIFEANG
jgi:hypothetical protein